MRFLGSNAKSVPASQKPSPVHGFYAKHAICGIVVASASERVIRKTFILSNARRMSRSRSDQDLET